jgi:hypothetical protein
MTSHTFPHEKLTPIIGKPTAASILILQAELYENAVSLDNPDTVVGHLGMIWPPAEYLLVPGVTGPYVPPAPPGPYVAPANILMGGDQYRAWTVQNTYYDTYKKGLVELKRQMLEAVEKTWTNTLCHPIYKYAQVTPAEIFAHLKSKYGKVTNIEATNNRNKLHAEWNENEPIANLWDRQNRISAFATFANVPIPDHDKLNVTIEILTKCRKYDKAVENWYNLSDAQQTWDNMVEHFERFETNRQQLLTTRGAGFHGAKVAETTTDNETAASANTIGGDKTTNNVIGNSKAPPVTPSSTTRERPPNNYYVPPGAVVLGYCHTCGLTTSINHNSANCGTPGPDHDTTATFYNPKGGNMVVTNKRKYTNKDKKPRSNKK